MFGYKMNFVKTQNRLSIVRIESLWTDLEKFVKSHQQLWLCIVCQRDPWSILGSHCCGYLKLSARQLTQQPLRENADWSSGERVFRRISTGDGIHKKDTHEEQQASLDYLTALLSSFKAILSTIVQVHWYWEICENIKILGEYSWLKLESFPLDGAGCVQSYDAGIVRRQLTNYAQGRPGNTRRVTTG